MVKDEQSGGGFSLGTSGGGAGKLLIRPTESIRLMKEDGATDLLAQTYGNHSAAQKYMTSGNENMKGADLVKPVYESNVYAPSMGTQSKWFNTTQAQNEADGSGILGAIRRFLIDRYIQTMLLIKDFKAGTKNFFSITLGVITLWWFVIVPVVIVLFLIFGKKLYKKLFKSKAKKTTYKSTYRRY